MSITFLTNEDEKTFIKSINGVKPDPETGDVKITIPNPGSGGNVDQVSVEPAEDDIPKVFLTGDEFGNMTTAKNEVKMGLEYISKTDEFKAAIKIKFQGNTSLTFPKKNFTIKMYTDDTYEDKLKKKFKDWNHSGNKYVLKANYVDHSHARNIVSANLWSQVVASRPDYNSLPEELRNSPRNGAIDGFPVKLYVNGTYQGIYTWNIGKDDWMWGMDEDNANHILMCAETNDNGTKISTPCNFRALWSGTDENHWTVEVGTNSTAVKNALNNLIHFVMDNDGEAFRNGIGNYLDIQSAIDYYLFMYAICGLDGLAKNMLLATYDGTVWHCGAYDMDSTFGLWYNGSKFVPATYACPEQYQETNSLLWERIEANYVNELKTRYAELRKSVLSVSNMFTVFERFMDRIGLDLFAEDLTIYTSIPSGSTNNIKQIRNYIRDRLDYVDAEFEAMAEAIPCTGISLNKSTLNFTAEGTQTIIATVTPDGCTDPITWESNNTSVATVNGGVVTAVANGSATITANCGEYSANCSVAVSGIAEPIPCTGITLDKTELSFEGEGTQIIVATVTPSDTADTVIWTVSPVGIVTVNDGVVTPVANGSCTITATCGEYSATCEVSVSGIVLIDYELNPLDSVTWHTGNSYNTEGVMHEQTGQTCTDKFTLQGCKYNYTTPSGQTWPALLVWDENDNFYGRLQIMNGGNKFAFIAKPEYKYALDMASDNTSAVILLPVDNRDSAFGTMSISLADRTWTSINNATNRYETDVSDVLSEAGMNNDEFLNGIRKASELVVFGEVFSFTLKSPYIVCTKYNGTPLVQVFTDPTIKTADALKSWLADNCPVLTIN